MIIFLARLATAGMICSFCFGFPFFSLAHAGECLDSRDTMLTDYRKGVQEAIANPKGDYDLGPWIESCWFYWDPKATDYLDDALADEVVKTLSDSRVPVDVKAASIAIAANAAPRRLFAILPSMMAQGKIPTRSQAITKDGTDVMLSIWARYGKTDKEISSFDYHSLLKKYRPGLFQPPADGLVFLHQTLAVLYPFDYPKARLILESWGLLPLSKYGEMTRFRDPRALEDVEFNFGPDSDNKPIYPDMVYDALARHLELEFKEEWLNHLEKKHYRLLRNAIYSSYGYKFKDKELKAFFSLTKEMQTVCRNGICGKTANVYNDNLLTEADKKNLAKLTAREQK